MSEGVYIAARQKMLSDLLAGQTLRLVALSAGDVDPQAVLSLDNAMLSDIPQEARLEESPELTGVVIENARLEAAPLQNAFTATEPAEINAIALFLDSGNPMTSRLLAIWDSTQGIDIQSTGNALHVSWRAGLIQL